MKLNFFKKKKSPVAKRPQAKVEPVLSKKSDSKGQSQHWNTLRGPHVTEKASSLNALNQYVFRIFSDANKIQIKNAVENLYNVKVDAVKVLNMPAKKRTLGRVEGQKSSFKKAIVKLAEGQKIDLIPK